MKKTGPSLRVVVAQTIHKHHMTSTIIYYDYSYMLYNVLARCNYTMLYNVIVIIHHIESG